MGQYSWVSGPAFVLFSPSVLPLLLCVLFVWSGLRSLPLLGLAVNSVLSSAPLVLSSQVSLLLSSRSVSRPSARLLVPSGHCSLSGLVSQHSSLVSCGLWVRHGLRLLGGALRCACGSTASG